MAQTIPKGHNRVAHTPTDTSTSKLKVYALNLFIYVDLTKIDREILIFMW